MNIWSIADILKLGDVHLRKRCYEMEEIINQTWEIRKKCEEYANLLSQKCGEDDPRVACFNMIFNKATLTFELLKNYHSIWKLHRTYPDKEEINRIREENAQRCNMATKALFVDVISSIEFNTKNTIYLYPNHPLTECVDRREKLIEHFDPIYSELDKEAQDKLRKFRKKLKDVPPFDSFWRIIEKSQSISLIDKQEANIWKFIIEVRNCTIHNNAIASRDCQVNIDGCEFQLEEGQMTKGKLDFYTFLSRKLVDCFFDWAQRFDTSQS